MPTSASEKSLSPAQAWDLGSNEFLFILKGFNMKAYFFVAALLLVAGTLITGCDVGVNPLLFDGAPAQATFRVDEPEFAYAGSETISLEDVLSAIDGEIDSVKVFNITLLIDSTAGTSDTTKFSGDARLNGSMMVQLHDTPMADFATERSIFDNSITGLTVYPGIISTIHSLLTNRPAPEVTISFTVSSNTSPLHFTAHVKIYTQIYTKAK